MNRVLKWIIVGLWGVVLPTLAQLIPVIPADGEEGVISDPELSVAVAVLPGPSEPIRFYGRASAPMPPDFTIAVLPDTQRYVIGKGVDDPSFFKDQVDWIVANRAASNIVYVSHVGDIVQDYDNDADEWAHAADAMYRLENSTTTGLPEGIPYGLVVGNHDLTGTNTTFYNQLFGPGHFAGRSYYGGNFGDNNFTLFESGALKFLNLNIIWEADLDVVGPWAEQVVAGHPDRLVLVTTHHLTGDGFPSSFSDTGQAIYDRLKTFPNILFMIGGHAFGDGRREDLFEGRTIHSFLSNYQGLPNGGNGWMRLYRCSPSNGTIRAITYSPVLDGFMEGETSDFTIPFDFAPWLGEWKEIGRLVKDPGNEATIVWMDREPLRSFEWFAEVSTLDGPVKSPLARFTTGANLHLDITREASVSGVAAEISWRSFPGRSYVVESAETAAGDWNVEETITAVGTHLSWFVADPTSTRSFRVRLVTP